VIQFSGFTIFCSFSSCIISLFNLFFPVLPVGIISEKLWLVFSRALHFVVL
jgi:hypothetical protein